VTVARIEIDENPPALSITLSQTLLRWLLGLILVAYGVQKLTHLGTLSDALAARSGLAGADAQGLVYAIAGIALAAGAGLILGWFTRFSAFVLVCANGLAFALELSRSKGAFVGQASLELPLVLISAGILFVFAGSGPLSMDAILRERRRLRAIEKDAIWSQPPYVGLVPDSWSELTDGDLTLDDEQPIAHQSVGA
jgi:putative oxidoreductase